MKPFRFAVLTHGHRTGRQWRAFARQVESLGYDVLHMAHHLSLPLAPPMVALAFAAEATERLRGGTLVYDVNTIHPAVLAQEAAWLARLSGERFELGVGAGWLATDYEVLGRSLGPPAHRVARLEEALELVRRCWSGAPTTFSGPSVAVADLDNGTDCPEMRIPLLVGGAAPGSSCWRPVTPTSSASPPTCGQAGSVRNPPAPPTRRHWPASWPSSRRRPVNASGPLSST